MAPVQDFQIYLQQEYGRRLAANRSYSLRAFAKALALNHATLSGFLSGKRKITKKSVEKIGRRLGLSPSEMGLAQQTAGKSTPYFVIQQDAFASMSEWHYDAILELSRVPVRLDADFVAKSLGISELTARLALDTLVRLELLEKKGGRLRLARDCSTNILDPDLSSAAQRKYQKSLLEKSMEALELVPRLGRDHTSVTMAIRKKDVPRAKELLKKFRREFSALLQENGAPDEVYQLQLSFFPLTDLKKRRNP